MKSSFSPPFSLASVPIEAGVYQYFDKNNNVIYVGKAKNLRKRVASYFQKKLNSGRIKLMISQISRLEFTIVNSEFDALLLENNLIKNLSPKYNILLRDDKTYPHIIIKKEPFPRIYSTRNKNKKGTYFGPFANTYAMKQVLELIHKLYPLRTCKYNLSNESIAKKKYKVCLEYHINNCKGPCEKLQSEEEYEEYIRLSKYILKGNLSKIKKQFKEKMNKNAEKLEFEIAQSYKEKIDLLEKYQAYSVVDNNLKENLDVLTLVSDKNYAYTNYLKVEYGTITATHSSEIKKNLDESDIKIAIHMIINFREKYQSKAKYVISNLDLHFDFHSLKIYCPKAGNKKKLIALSLKNALFHKKEKILAKGVPDEKKHKTLNILKENLRMKEMPMHIECFDNSNIQGTNPVASMVCFLKGKPAKKEYRHYKIKTVVGPDDFASMYEVVYRRYARLIEENRPLPQLIVVDGGKGQLSVACRALDTLNILGKITIIGIAKRLEEIYYPEDPHPLHISKKSPALKLLQQLRNEAHRFAITFHKNLRSKNAIQSKILNIPNLGEKTMLKLYNHFKTVKYISTANIEDLSNVIGQSKAKLVYKYFNN